MASRSICCCPLRPLPTYSSIFSSYYIIINYLLCVIFTQPYAYIVSCASTHVSWWSIRVDPYFNWTIRVVPYLSVSWNYSLWWLIYGGLTVFGGLYYQTIYLCVIQLLWMFLCELIVMWHSIMWSKLTYVFQPHIFIHFTTSSMYFAIISIPTALPIDRGYFKPPCWAYLAVSSHISACSYVCKIQLISIWS